MSDLSASDANYAFFITPLGSDDGVVRARADEIQSIIAEVLTPHSLAVIRADQIGEPGMITDQIVRLMGVLRGKASALGWRAGMP